MCPQTLFMEMVYRKIEYLIEGDAPAQRRLAKEPWTASKVSKKTLKHTIFLLISIVIAHTVMAYLIGVDDTFAIVTNSPTENLAGFFGLTSFTLIIYGVYAKFREQACIAVCPYGRLQSVLLTKESVVVAYDWLRGEPRRPIKKNVAEMVPAGDCIDCKLCVHVCPTGIDIRNGTQLECVNCTACIDVCDDVMLKVGRPKGLIRFASFKSIEEGIQKIFTGKVIGYSVVLTLLISVLAFVLISRSDVETTVLKVPGTLYQRDKNDITNLYNIEFVNKTFRELKLNVKVEAPAHATLVNVDGKPVVVAPEDMIKQVWFIRIPAERITNAKTIVRLGIYEDGKLLETLKVKFIGPVGKQKDSNTK
jgi:cytochrome c oxidase accessory protein FixG